MNVEESETMNDDVETCDMPTHKRFSDLTGQVFERLTVLRYVRPGEHSGQYYWLCRCECGNEKAVLSTSLLTRHTKSCGCLRRGPKKGARWKPCGKLVGRSTQRERRGKAPLYAELVEQRETLIRVHRTIQEHLGAVRRRERLLGVGLDVSLDLGDVDLDLEKAVAAWRTREAELRAALEVALGYFLQSDRWEQCARAEVVEFVSMCLEYPPFTPSVLRRLLSSVVEGLAVRD